jgi:hypothetical protein
VSLGGARRLRGGPFGSRRRRIGDLRRLCGTVHRQGSPEMLSEQRCHRCRDVGRSNIGFCGIGFGGIGFRNVRFDGVAGFERRLNAWRRL